MYPHERSLVQRLEGKPFALLGINSDSSREALKETLKKEHITWRSWWDGGSTEGPIASRWDVSSWPTTYVLDHHGVIRFRNVRREELDKAVEALLKGPTTSLFDRKRIFSFVALCFILALALQTRFQIPNAWHANPRIGNLNGIGWVGISFDGVMDQDAHRLDPSALRITRVVAGGPADQAGLRTQDIIIRLNGRPFAGVLQLQDDVARMRVGDALRLDVRRDGQERSFTMRLVSWRHIVDLSRKTPGDGIGL
jgi:hypothetical protein